MIKKYCNLLLQLTQYILEEYWQNNQKPLIEHMHKDILWIGSTNSEYLHGKDQMIKRIEENKQEMPPVFLDEQEYEVVDNDTKLCLVVGRYRAYTKPESGLLLSEKQRVTFLWVKIKSEGKDLFFIKHIHLSNILKMQGEDERFPTRAGKENYEKMQKLLAERSLGEVISVKDTNKVTRVINYSDIMYMKTDHNYMEIYMSGESMPIRIRGNLSIFAKKLPEYFIELGRSAIVNRNFVIAMDERIITMINRTKFQVPLKNVKQIRKKLYSTD